jgi:hypothetical protein
MTMTGAEDSAETRAGRRRMRVVSRWFISRDNSTETRFPENSDFEFRKGHSNLN